MNSEKIINSIIRNIKKQKIELQKKIKLHSKFTYSIYCRSFCAVSDEDYDKLIKEYDDSLADLEKQTKKLIIYNKIIKRQFNYSFKKRYLILRDNATNKKIYRHKIYF